MFSLKTRQLATASGLHFVFLGKLRRWDKSNHAPHPVCVKTKHPTVLGGLLRIIQQIMFEGVACLYCYICSTVL